MHYDVLYPSMNAKKSVNIIIERNKKKKITITSSNGNVLSIECVILKLAVLDGFINFYIILLSNYESYFILYLVFDVLILHLYFYFIYLAIKFIVYIIKMSY